MSSKPMRELMPEITALVDALRARGMTDNATLSAGLKDGTFWARENGHTIGDPSLNKDVGVVPALPLEAEARLLDKLWAEQKVLPASLPCGGAESRYSASASDLTGVKGKDL